jgi:pentose-5-phosphate-3-epimerase/putative flippase GtrA
MIAWKQSWTRARRRWSCSSTAFHFFKYRYLIAFTAFGILSILVELSLLKTLPSNWSEATKTVSAFSVGLLISFTLNSLFNFRVPWKYFASTFFRFSVVSVASFVLNRYAIAWTQAGYSIDYATSRLLCSGSLFLVAYAIHRRLTFKIDRNFGIAVYASPVENVRRVFLKVGRNCDHIHIDLVDNTVQPTAQVDLNKIAIARRLWPSVPFAIHFMTRRPEQWLDKCLENADWFLFSIASDTPLLPLIAKCHMQGKKAGVVWHVSDPVDSVYQYLPHVDFVMVLGIERPGQSGQKLQQSAVNMAQMIERLRSRYTFELMFDGSVNSDTIRSIPARYIVAASSVLKAKRPAQAIYTLKSGARHERTAA